MSEPNSATTNDTTPSSAPADSILSKRNVVYLVGAALLLAGAYHYSKRNGKKPDETRPAPSVEKPDVLSEEINVQTAQQSIFLTESTDEASLFPTSASAPEPAPRSRRYQVPQKPSAETPKTVEAEPKADTSAASTASDASTAENASTSAPTSAPATAESASSQKAEAPIAEQPQESPKAKKPSKKKKSASSQNKQQAKAEVETWDPQRDPVFNSFLAKNFMTSPPVLIEESGVSLPVSVGPDGEPVIDQEAMKKEENEWIARMFEGLSNLESGRKDIVEASFIDGFKAAKKANNLQGMAICNFCQGYFHASSGDYKKGATHYLLALRMWEKVYPSGHPASLLFLFDLGQVYKELNKLDEALPMYSKCIEFLKQGITIAHFSVDYVEEVVADVYTLQGKYAEAEVILENVIKAREALESTNDPKFASALLSQSLVKRYLGKNEESEALEGKWMGILLDAYGGRKEFLGQCLNTLSTMYRTHKLLLACERMCILTLQVMKEVYQELSIQYGQALGGYADLLRELKRYDESLKAIERTQTIFLRLKNKNDPDLMAVNATKARLLGDMGRVADAEELFVKSIMTLGQNPHENMILVLSLYYEFLVSHNQHERAAAVQEQIAQVQMILSYPGAF